MNNNFLMQFESLLTHVLGLCICFHFQERWDTILFTLLKSKFKGERITANQDPSFINERWAYYMNLLQFRMKVLDPKLFLNWYEC